MAASNDNNAVASEVNTAVAKLKDHLATAFTGADNTDDGGRSTTIITLAGENKGATMDVAGDHDVAEDLVVVGNADAEEENEGEEAEDESVVSAYANSNYQAVNNSVLVAGSCAVNDPGVHVIVVEHVDEIRDYDVDQDIDNAQEF